MGPHWIGRVPQLYVLGYLLFLMTIPYYFVVSLSSDASLSVTGLNYDLKK